jgi:hypothetical protein
MIRKKEILRTYTDGSEDAPLFEIPQEIITDRDSGPQRTKSVSLAYGICPFHISTNIRGTAIVLAGSHLQWVVHNKRYMKSRVGPCVASGITLCIARPASGFIIPTVLGNNMRGEYRLDIDPVTGHADAKCHHESR